MLNIKVLSNDNISTEVLVEIYGFKHRKTRVFVSEILDGKVGVEKLVAPRTLIHIDIPAKRRYIITRNKRWLNTLREKIELRPLSEEEVKKLINDINPRLLP